MNHDNLPLALRKMGYRRPDPSINPNRWVKPVGFIVFIVDVDLKRIQSAYVGPVDKQMHSWASFYLCSDSSTSLEQQIAVFEQYDEAKKCPLEYSDLSFLTKEETSTYHFSQ